MSTNEAPDIISTVSQPTTAIDNTPVIVTPDLIKEPENQSSVQVPITPISTTNTTTIDTSTTPVTEIPVISDSQNKELGDYQKKSIQTKLEFDKDLFRGIKNDEFFVLLRRFNAQINQVLSPPTTSLPVNSTEPDLRRSNLPIKPFDSQSIQINVERLYASTVVPSIIFYRELKRLMSWNKENRFRTGMFSGFYFIAWWFGLILPSVIGLLITLILFPASRSLLFPSPPTPLNSSPSALDPTNQAGDESLLPSSTSATKSNTTRTKAEQIEQQSSELLNFGANFFSKIILGGQTSKNKQGEENSKLGLKGFEEGTGDEQGRDNYEGDEGQRDKGKLGPSTSDSQKTLDGNKLNLSQEQIKNNEAKEVKVKRDALINSISKSLQDMLEDALGDGADFMEVFGRSLSPSPIYYPRYYANLKIITFILFPTLLITTIVSAQIWSEIFSFLIGFIFFFNEPLRPVVARGFERFVEAVPDWREKLDLRNTIFSGVPTDAQLILHLIRISESNYQPIPPAPNPPRAPKHIASELSTPSISSASETTSTESRTKLTESGELERIGEKEEEEEEKEEEEDESLGKTMMKKSKRKILGAVKTTAGKVAKIGADIKDTKEQETQDVGGGNEEEQEEDGEKKGKVATAIGKVWGKTSKDQAEDFGTPESYPARLDGTSGHILITHAPSHKPSTISFIPLKSETPTFSAPISNLIEIKKSGISIARTALGWAADLSLEGMGLELRLKESDEIILEEKIGLGNKEVGVGGEEGGNSEIFEGKVWNFEHVGRRDQLFCRLLAIGGQKWESL